MSQPDKSILSSLDIINSLAGGLVAFEDDGTIHTMNDSLAKLLDYQNGELTGRNIETIFTLSTNIFYQTHIFPLLQLKGNIEEIFLSLKSRTGDSVPVLLYGRRVSRDDRVLNLWELLPVWQRKKFEEEILSAKRAAEKAIEDNADLRRIRAELELKAGQLDRQILRLSQINEEYAAFSKIISHDLQEPIRKIHLFTDILTQSATYSGTSAKYFEKIYVAVNRLSSLTECLERYVSIDTTSEPPQPVSLDRIIERSKAKAIDITGFQDFDFFADAMPEIDGYPSLLVQLFLEMFKNAIQYRDKNRRLIIRMTSVIAKYNHYKVNENKYNYIDFVKLDLMDNGTGFDEKYAGYIFQMFQRLDFKIPGMGFGLALAKKIVDKHFGTITASGENGAGSSFQVLLPIKNHDI